MTHAEWLALMNFPAQWSEGGLLPEELQSIQLNGYEPGHEGAPEHDRHGAFQWWLQREVPKETIIRLTRLTWLDPDPLMGGYVRECLAKKYGEDKDIQDAILSPYKP